MEINEKQNAKETKTFSGRKGSLAKSPVHLHRFAYGMHCVKALSI